MSQFRSKRRPIHGVFLLDKASGYSSNASLQKVKRLFNAQKAGHTGSLDPIASGLLPICLGEATKLSSYLLHSDKRYVVRIRLGIETDTADIEGAVISEAPVPPLTATLIDEVLTPFRGEITQVPPMYSALKHQGQRLYDLARKGVEIEREPRPITIYELLLKDFDDSSLDLEVHCSKGTYIRSLAQDIGRALGCGGHVEVLRRTAVGDLLLENATTVDVLEALEGPLREASLQPMDGLVAHFPRVDLNDSLSVLVRQGNPVFVAQAPTSGWVRLYGLGLGFIGLGEVLDDGRVGPRRILQLEIPSASRIEAGSDEVAQEPLASDVM